MASIDAMTMADAPICPKWVRSPIWRRRVEKALHKFSSTQFNIEDASYTRTQGSPRHKIEAMARRIADEDLAKDGREDRPHVTVKYGLHTGNVEEVRRVVQGFGTVKIKLGKTSLFPASKDHPFEVVKIDVSGDSLHRLNRLITNSVECTDTHPTYKPHVTLAYVKPGAGKKYVGMTDVDGMEISCHRLVFSDQDKNKTAIYLDGITKALPAPVGAPRIAKPKNGLPPGFSGIAPPDAAGRRYQYVNGRRVNRTDNDNLPDNDAGKQTPPPEPPSMPSQASQQPQTQTQPFQAPKMPQQPAQQQPEQSQSQQWSVSPAASSVINNHRANAEQRGKQAIDKVTSSWNGPKDDVAKQELASKLKQSFDQAEITINFKPSTTSIFESGMLKTAYETSKGNKGYLGARKKQEKEVLGAGDDMQHSDRPVYAAVNWDKNLYGAASPYGHASFVLNRDAIKERATLTPRDTWGLRNSDEVATMDNPLAAIATNDKALKTAGYKDHGVDDKIVHGSGAYTEVQIWGGSMPLNKQTVKEIRLPNGGAYEHEAQAAKAFADKHGITLTVFDPKNGKTVAFDQAQFAKKKPSLWNRLLGRKSMSRKHLRRSPIWKALKRKSVSGLRRDSRGREYLWVNGKRVAKPKTVGEPIDGRGLEKIASFAEKAIFESLNQVADLVNAVKVIGGGVVSGVNKGQELYGKFTDYIDSQVKKLPGPVEKVVRGAYKLYCAPYAMAQKATGELAKEHGFSPATVHRISATVAVVDFVAGKAQSLFGVGSSIVPLGSLAYLVFATAVHPVATYRAARKGIERARTKLGVVKGMLPEATMVALGERMEKYGEDYFAAFLVAMDTERDAKKAMRLADEVVRGREQEEKHLDLTAHILAGIVGGMVTKSMRAFVIKATKRREGEQWVTNGRHYRRSGGKTVRIAPPGGAKEPEIERGGASSMGGLSIEESRAMSAKYRAKVDEVVGMPFPSTVAEIYSQQQKLSELYDEGVKLGKRNFILQDRDSLRRLQERESMILHAGPEMEREEREQARQKYHADEAARKKREEEEEKARTSVVEPGVQHFIFARNERGQKVPVAGPYESEYAAKMDYSRIQRLVIDNTRSAGIHTVGYSFAKTGDAEAQAKLVATIKEKFPLGLNDSSKEPWEMTKEEYKKDRIEFMRKEMGRDPWAGQEYARAEFGIKAQIRHEELVKDAIAAGKSVPAEVLADYPDLKLSTSANESQVIAYEPSLPIRNVDSLPRGTGARYLLAIVAHNGDLIAKEWKRTQPASLKDDERLIDFKAKKSVFDAKYAAAKDAVNRLKGGDPNAVDDVMESLGKLTVPQLRQLAKEQGFAKVSGRAKKEILDGLKAGLVPGNSAVGGGTSVGSSGSSPAAVSEAFVDRFFNYVYKDSLNSDRFKNETPDNQAALIAKGKQESRAQLEKMAKRIVDKDVSLVDRHALHPSNKMYRELFTEVTGITLPSGSEATRKAVKEFLGEKYQEHAKSRADKEANEAKEKADKKRVEKETKDSEYSGFAADLPPRQRAKIHATLETSVSNNGKPTTRKELVERLVKAGFAVDGEKLTNGSNYYDKQAMTKTGLDYASHLVKQGFGPKEGERNSAGLVFHNHRWHREDDIDPVRVDLRQLSSGTMATLTGRDKYDDIEAARKMLDAWLSARPGVKWGSWQDAWGEFVAKYPEYSKDRPEEPKLSRAESPFPLEREERKSEPASTDSAKEPWEMTASELENYKESHPDFAAKYDRKYSANFVLAHMEFIKDAIKAGKVVPLRVRKQTGDVEFWEKTKEELLNKAAIPGGGIRMFGGSSPQNYRRVILSTQEREELEQSHRTAIVNALAAGKPVPAEVLADYPDLKPKADVPKSSRQTPSKGTPERDKQDAEWNDTYAKVEAAAEAASKVKEERDNTKRSTKKYDTLDAKYRKLQDEYEAMHRDMQPLRKLNRLALLEDTIEHGDEANAIAAKAMMDREAGNNKRHDDAYTKIMSLAEASLKSNYGLTDSDSIKSIAMDATSMVLGYPGIESTLDVRLKGAVTTYNRKTANRVNREAIDALNDLSKEQKASFHRRVENAEFAPDTQSQIVAEAKAENESNRELNKLAAEHEKRAEESRQEREAFDPDIDSIPVKSIRTKGLIKDLNVDGRWGFIGTAKATGYATNGKYMFKLPEKEMAVIRSTPDNGNRTLPQQTLDTLLNSNHEVEPATIKGVRHLEDVDLNSPTYLIESPHGTQALMNATYVRLILDRYPNATMHLPPPVEKSKSTTRPVVFKDQGTVIGVVMPIEDGRKYKVKG